MKGKEDYLKILRKIYKMSIMPISIFIQMFIKTNNEKNFDIAQTLIVNQTHTETFKKYKNAFNERDVVIVATAPSLNNYNPIKGAIHIGCNKAFLHKNIKLDYLFMMDYDAVKDYIDKLDDEAYSNIEKFYGIYPEKIYGLAERDSTHKIIPESIAIRHNAKRYYLYSYKGHFGPTKFYKDIDKAWIADGASVVFSAMQFALFTNPKRIYLVGCDCSNGYFDKAVKKVIPNKPMIKTWKTIKKFRDIYYPETEIISINPVGLKGLFTDLYNQ